MVISGDMGSSEVDRTDKIAVEVFGVLLIRQSFIWLDELGGSVIVEWYARRR